MTTQLVVYHPKLDDNGLKVALHTPTKPSEALTWFDPDTPATFVPMGQQPEVLGSIPLATWINHPRTNEEWRHVPGQIELDEPPLKAGKGLKAASGIVVVEGDGRIWLTWPSNAYGGYRITVPKGKNESGLPLQANAIREVFEETGLHVVVTGLLGDFIRTTSVTRLYLGKRVGGCPTDMGWESQAVSLVPRRLLKHYLEHPSDQAILKMLL